MTDRHSSSPDDQRSGDTFDAADDDRFNEALEAMLQGDRRGLHELDSEMGSTIDQLFAWAELSGYTDEPVTLATPEPEGQAERGSSFSKSNGAAHQEPFSAPPTSTPAASVQNNENRGDAKVKRSKAVELGVSRTPAAQHGMRLVVSAVQAIAAIVLIGFAAFGVRSLLIDLNSQSDPNTGSLVAVNTTPPPTAIPTPTPHPTNEPESSDNYVVPPLSVKDCAADPRSREELLNILATPPAANPELGIGSMNADAETREEIGTLLRGWWSCHAYGKTWEQTAYESDQYIRETIYGNPRASTAFSRETLNELLDSHSQLDAERLSVLPPDANEVLTLVPNGIVWISPEDSPGPRMVIAEVTLVSASTGQAHGESHEVYFVYEDGSWKIRSIDPGNSPILSKNFTANWLD